MQTQKREIQQIQSEDSTLSGAIKRLEDPKNLTELEIMKAPPMVKVKDKGSLIVWIYSEVRKMFLLLGKEDLNEQALEMYTEQIFDLMKWDSMYDLALILKNGSRGQYGKMYGNFSLLIFSEWRAIYLDKKAEIREKFIHNRKFSESGEEYNAEGLSQVYKRILDKQLMEEEPKEKKPVFRANEKYFQDQQNKELIAMAHHALTVGSGKPEYSPTAQEVQEWIDNKLKEINEGINS